MFVLLFLSVTNNRHKFIFLCIFSVLWLYVGDEDLLLWLSVGLCLPVCALCFSTFSRTLDQIAPISTKSWNLRRVRMRGCGSMSTSGMFKNKTKKVWLQMCWSQFFICSWRVQVFFTLYSLMSFKFTKTVLTVQTTTQKKGKNMRKTKY